MTLPQHLFSSDSSNPWWPQQKTGIDSEVDHACAVVMTDLFHFKSSQLSELDKAKAALANHFYFFFHLVDGNQKLAFSLTPVFLWEAHQDTWADHHDWPYHPVLQDFSQHTLADLIQAQPMAIEAQGSWGAGCFVYEEQDILEMFEHLTQCGFPWHPALQKKHDPLMEMGLFNEILRLRQEGGRPDEKSLSEHLAHDLFKIGFSNG